MVEELIGNPAAKQCAEDTSNLHVCHNACSAHHVIALAGGEVNNAPALYCVTCDVYAEGSKTKNPNCRVLNNGIPLH